MKFAHLGEGIFDSILALPTLSYKDPIPEPMLEAFSSRVDPLGSDICGPNGTLSIRWFS
jgi:hypothetical protein